MAKEAVSLLYFPRRVMTEALEMLATNSKAERVCKQGLAALGEHRDLLVYGPAHEGAVLGTVLANRWAELCEQTGHFTDVPYIDCTMYHQYMTGKALPGGDDTKWENLDDMLDACELIVWGKVSHVSNKISYEIDAAIAKRFSNESLNIITGWNPPEFYNTEHKYTVNNRKYETRELSAIGFPLLYERSQKPKYTRIFSTTEVDE